MAWRWNGWGDETIDVPVAPTAAALLERLIGPGDPRPDASLADVVAAVPTSRLPADPLVETDPELRVRHARGQSLPDWVALRSGRLGAVPDGVARPADGAGVRRLLELAATTGAAVIPYGGGTSVVGGIDPSPAPDGPPVLTISLERLAGLRSFDERSGLATFGAGTMGPAV